jgi:hypothetical protein
MSFAAAATPAETSRAETPGLVAFEPFQWMARNDQGNTLGNRYPTEFRSGLELRRAHSTINTALIWFKHHLDPSGFCCVVLEEM